MKDILAEICDYKREHITKQRRERAEDSLLRDARDMAAARGFHAALKARVEAREIGLIAEIKKASPSRGVIRADFDHRRIAEVYAKHGATCLSVLTDERYFQGADAYIAEVKEVCGLPVLRKDFMLEPYQIVESRALGADCILLIMAALGDGQASELFAAARELGMNVLVEVHNREELDRACRLPLDMLGVNNRNLKTLEVDLATSHTLAPHIPEGAIRIAESGVKAHGDITDLQKSGFYSYLVGESLMSQADIGTAVDQLLSDH